jgi:MFS family permease
LVFGRFLEAIGASAGLSISIAIINDFYFEEQARKIMGLLTIAFAIIPGLAITIGGVIAQYFTWQSCFYFLLIYGLVLIYPTHHLPETNLKPDLEAFDHQHLFQNYAKHFKMKKLIGFAIINGLSCSCIYVFGADGPFIGIHLLKTQPSIYGFLALIPYVGVLVGCFITVKLSSVNAYSVLKIAFIFELIASVVMLTLFLCHIVSLPALFIPMILFCIGHPIITATTNTLSMHETEDKSNGSSVINFISMCMPVVMMLLLSNIHIVKAWIIPFIFLISLFLMTLTFFWCTNTEKECHQ